jgi:RNA polymerase sigma-70 factor (family 1)
MQEGALHNESQLVRSLSKGDLSAFNTLYYKYSGRLYYFALGYLKSEAEAEELVQEVFTIIWEKRTTLKEELSFKSFLFTITFNIIRKHFRARTYLSDYFKTLINDDLDLQTTQKINYDSFYNYLRDLVDQMPDRRREIFIKSRFDGLSVKEISEVLHISHKTVENQLTDALKFLRININREIIPVILFLMLFNS